MNLPKFKEDIFGINGVGERQLLHPYFEKWHKWIVNEYEPPKGKIGVFVPCAAVKPYYNSPIHKVFNKIIDEFPTHKIVISNAGVIPYEFADLYPFNSYDWNPAYETIEIKARYVEVTKRRVQNYLKTHGKFYASFIAYLHPDSGSLKALKEVKEENDTPLSIVNVKKVRLSPTVDHDLILAHSINLERLKKTLGEIK